MLTEQDLREAQSAGERFQKAILSAQYVPQWDQVLLATPWGFLSVPKDYIQEFRNLDKEKLSKIYVSSTGVHVHGTDVDINSAGLLFDLLKDLQGKLANSF